MNESESVNVFYEFERRHNDAEGLIKVMLAVIPRLHDATGCQTGLTTGCIHDTAGCQTGCQTVLV